MGVATPQCVREAQRICKVLQNLLRNFLQNQNLTRNLCNFLQNLLGTSSKLPREPAPEPVLEAAPQLVPEAAAGPPPICSKVFTTAEDP